MESESAHSARIGERREEADAGLRGVHSSGPREESCLSKSLTFSSLTEKTAPAGLGRAEARPCNYADVGVSLLGLVILFGAGCKQQKQPAPDVWASVNGQDIKRDDVDKFYRTRVSPEGEQPSQEEALSLKLNVLDELINNEILLERAKKLNLEASDGEVEDKFTELKSPYTEDEFQRQLK